MDNEKKLKLFQRYINQGGRLTMHPELQAQFDQFMIDGTGLDDMGYNNLVQMQQFKTSEGGNQVRDSIMSGRPGGSDYQGPEQQDVGGDYQGPDENFQYEPGSDWDMEGMQGYDDDWFQDVEAGGGAMGEQGNLYMEGVTDNIRRGDFESDEDFNNAVIRARYEHDMTLPPEERQLNAYNTGYGAQLGALTQGDYIPYDDMVTGDPLGLYTDYYKDLEGMVNASVFPNPNIEGLNIDGNVMSDKDTPYTVTQNEDGSVALSLPGAGSHDDVGLEFDEGGFRGYGSGYGADGDFPMSGQEYDDSVNNQKQQGSNQVGSDRLRFGQKGWLRQQMTDDRGIFRGGKQGRVFGRIRDAFDPVEGGAGHEPYTGPDEANKLPTRSFDGSMLGKALQEGFKLNPYEYSMNQDRDNY